MSEYGYVFCVRMGHNGKRYVDSWMDVSRFIGKSFEEFVAASMAKAKLLGQEVPEKDSFIKDLNAIHMMKLRARFNMMDGPLYVRTDEPMNYDHLDSWVSGMSQKEYKKFIKTYRFK